MERINNLDEFEFDPISQLHVYLVIVITEKPYNEYVESAHQTMESAQMRIDELHKILPKGSHVELEKMEVENLELNDSF